MQNFYWISQCESKRESNYSAGINSDNDALKLDKFVVNK